MRVAFAADHLGCHILDGAAEAVGAVVLFEYVLLAETEVGERYVPVIVEQNAVGWKRMC